MFRPAKKNSLLSLVLARAPSPSCPRAVAVLWRRKKADSLSYGKDPFNSLSTEKFVEIPIPPKGFHQGRRGVTAVTAASRVPIPKILLVFRRRGNKQLLTFFSISFLKFVFVTVNIIEYYSNLAVTSLPLQRPEQCSGMERGWGGGGYRPYFDPDYESLPERINPPRVCVDNDTYDDCTLVKVDSANKHGILLEMVQVLTDLDLVISKSYISSDGGWFMDVFHVTDQFGRKLSDRSLISYIQQSLISRRMRSGAESVKTCLGRVVAPRKESAASPSSEYTALELTGTDQPGLLSELSAVLVEHECHVVSGQAWSHNSRVACILYLGTHTTGGPISDGTRLSELEEQLEQVMASHHGPHERWRVTLRAVQPPASQVHTERRLHQLMHEDRDFEEGEEAVGNSRAESGKMAAKVSIDSCEEKGYSVVSIRSKDRPKLLFDTVCTLTDMEYVVFHATVGSHGPVAMQEYFIRRMDGRPLDSAAERGRVARCLVAAIERRVSQGLRLKICTPNRIGLLSDVTRVFRENGLSMTAVEIGTRGERAVGTFYVTDAAGGEVDLKTVDAVREDFGGTVRLELENSPPWPFARSHSEPPTGGSAANERARFSLGSLLWSHIERLSNNFSSIRS